MRTKPISSRSSLLIWPVVLVFFAVAGILAGFYGRWLLSGVLLLLFLLMLSARLWAGAAGRQLEVSLHACTGAGDMFPGDTAVFRVELQNRKLLPLLWVELFQPLPRRACVQPLELRPVEAWEKPALSEGGFSEELAGETLLPPVRWYGTASAEITYHGVSRGLWSTRGWSVRTGDGLGLCQVELPIPVTRQGCYAVYPALQPVKTGPFLQNSWNADTGSRGVLEDVTVIRTTRDYQPGDSVRHMNWRLAARGQPLTVNLYEEITPRSVHFILDGESFSGPEKHPEELEETLSLLASELCALTEAGLQCGLSISRGSDPEVEKSGPEAYLGSREPGEEGLRAMLRCLAAYSPRPDLREGDTNHVVRQSPVFDGELLRAGLEFGGRCYYIAYSSETMPAVLPKGVDPERVTLLLWDTEKTRGDYAVLSLSSLKGGQSYGQ